MNITALSRFFQILGRSIQMLACFIYKIVKAFVIHLRLFVALSLRRVIGVHILRLGILLILHRHTAALGHASAIHIIAIIATVVIIHYSITLFGFVLIICGICWI